MQHAGFYSLERSHMLSLLRGTAFIFVDISVRADMKGRVFFIKSHLIHLRFLRTVGFALLLAVWHWLLI